MSTFGDGVYQYGGVPVGGYFTAGRAWFVRPGTGSDAASGKRPDRAFATLAQALSVATADSGEVVYLISEDNSASGTTDYQSSALDWNKDGVHLVGINSGNHTQQRSRIAQLSTATNVDNLFTVSANNCFFANFSVFHGVDDATSKGAVSISGDRNRFYNVTMSGIGHDTMDTAANYSLDVGGDENLFERCYVGLDTIARGTAATYEMSFSSGATRNLFRDCMVVSYAEAAGFAHVYSAASGMDRWNMFDRTIFMNMPTGDSSGTTMDEVFDITGGGSPDGIIIAKDCGFVGVTDVEKDTASGKVMLINSGTTSATGGKAVDAS